MISLDRTAHVRLPSRAGVAAWLRNAVPGTKVAVHYVDGEVGHECVLVSFGLFPLALVCGLTG